MPNLRGEHYDEAERETIGGAWRGVRAAADWIENAVTAAKPTSTSSSRGR
ncbi:DUF6192 family protein [Streptomyces sp. RB17]|nr:DUF6192 family protein [Streptomyces sp. RB17]